jgi:hypothetical protein
MDYGTFRATVRRLLDDDGTAESYSDEILHDGFILALRAVLPWLPNEQIEDLEPDGSTISFDIVGAYEIKGVYDNDTRTFLPKATLEPGIVRGSTLDWVDYPPGSVLFSQEPESSDELSVYFQAYWDEPDDDEDEEFEIPIPAAGLMGLLYYTMATVISMNVMRTAVHRRFGDRQQDAGQPEDNPMQKAQRHFMDLFHMEMERMPSYLGHG